MPRIPTTLARYNRVLRSLYYNISSPVYLSRLDLLYPEARKVLPLLTRGYVKAWLLKQDVYVRFKPVVHKFQREQIKIAYPDQYLEMDLFTLTNDGLPNYNDGYKYILLITDGLSKKLWAYPLLSKTARSTADALEQFFERDVKIIPEYVRTDQGEI